MQAWCHPVPVDLRTVAPLAEEAQKSVRGMEENAIHAKYIELVNNQFLVLYYTPGN